MVDGEVVEGTEADAETPEVEVETGTNTCCGCFNSAVLNNEGDEMINTVPEERGEGTETPHDDNLEAIGQSDTGGQFDMTKLVPEERLNLEGEVTEVTEVPDLETIAQSENEAEIIVRDLLDFVIKDMTI